MSTIAIIVGMGVVTFLPRLVPFLLPAARRPPRALARILAYVPPAALAALIVPGGFTAAGGNTAASLLALAVAATLARLGAHIGVTLLGAVAAAAAVIAVGM
jgi:branched-subunit amino acid transport protein